MMRSRVLPILLLLALAACSDGPAFPYGSSGRTKDAICANLQTVRDGWFVTFWKDGGEACMRLLPGGGYSTRYDLTPRFNLVAGMGWRTGDPDRVITYRADRFEAGVNSYLTLYGWSVDPLVEYYVVDDWGSRFRPPGPDARVLAVIDSDGGTYEIYRTTRTHQPSIRGIRTFDQYWSVRTQRRPQASEATITFGNHVAAWRKAGMKLGRMDYQVLATEGFGSDGGSSVEMIRERQR